MNLLVGQTYSQPAEVEQTTANFQLLLSVVEIPVRLDRLRPNCCLNVKVHAVAGAAKLDLPRR
jgi:hypothetical protein